VQAGWSVATCRGKRVNQGGGGSCVVIFGLTFKPGWNVATYKERGLITRGEGGVVVEQ